MDPSSPQLKQLSPQSYSKHFRPVTADLSPSQRLRSSLNASPMSTASHFRIVQAPAAEGIWSTSFFLPQNSKAPYIPQEPKQQHMFLGKNFKEIAQSPGPGAYDPPTSITPVDKNKRAPRIPRFDPGKSHGIVFSRTSRFSDSPLHPRPERPLTASPASARGNNTQSPKLGRSSRQLDLFGQDIASQTPGPGAYDPLLTAASTRHR